VSKASSPSVQLFPFLAVLICAMGALILLLLVTTRRMRHVAVERAIQEQRAKLAERAAAPVRVAPEPPKGPEPEHAPLYVPPVAIRRAKPVPVVDEEGEARLRAEWQTIIDELGRDYSDQVKLLAAIRADAVLKQKEQEAEKQALEVEQTRLETRKRKAYSIRQETAADIARLEGEQAQLDAELKKVKKATNIKAEELANQPVPYTLLPYDGALGTTRRPIIIECDERTLTFRCEGIELTASQLSGFPSEYNPILAGTRALHEYWVVRDRENATLKTPPPPYVLLVVRPKGTVAYYVARKLLEKFEYPFGYELVEEGRELTWPASDDDAVRVCRTAVERVLNERERVMARLAGPGGGPAGGPGASGGGGRYPVTGELRYDGQSGQFVTEEVEQLRNLDDSVVVGGQRWKRESRGGGGSSAPGPSGVPSPFQSPSSQSSAGGRRGNGSSDSQDRGNLGPAQPSRGAMTQGQAGQRQPGRDGPPDAAPSDGGPPSGGVPGGSESGAANAGDGNVGFGDAADSRLASADPDAAPGGGSGGGVSDDADSNGAVPAGPPSSGDSRSRSGSRTFQGSGGPRLGAGESRTGGGSPGRGRGGSGNSEGGDLHPYHEPAPRTTDPDAPQGTGPITTRNIPYGAKRYAGGGGGREGSPDSDLPPNGLRAAGQGSEGTGTADRPSGARSSGTGAGNTGQGAAGGGTPGSGPGGPGPGGSGSGSGSGGPGSGGSAGGSGSAGGGSATGDPGGEAGSPAPEGMPIPRNLRAIGQHESSGKGKEGRPVERRWGEPDHSGTIALERPVVIEVKDGAVVVEDEPEINLRDGTAYRELKDRLAFTLDSHVGKWGRPPASFYWLPNVTFRIHPGGNQYYQAMKALTDDWGIRSKVEHVLD